MNVEWLQHEIHNTLDDYVEQGVNVWLLSASDFHADIPPYDWVQVTVLVSSLDREPETWAETRYYGGVIQSQRRHPPLTLRPIDTERLISPMDAASKLPQGFPLGDASCVLNWALHPGIFEPNYLFRVDETAILVGAYTGKTAAIRETSVIHSS